MRIPLATAGVPRRHAQGSAFMVQVGLAPLRSVSTATAARLHVSLAATHLDSIAMSSLPIRSFLIAMLLSACPLATAWAGGVSVRALPEQPLVERLRDGQQLNFDLVFKNDSADALELVGLELTRYDRDGRFAGQQRLDRNGDSTTMSIQTVPNRALPANGALVVFNPFTRFASDDWLGAMKVEAVFVAGKQGPERRMSIALSPREFQAKTPLAFPLRGETFVHDGHDLVAHHRRLDITGGMTTHFGITGNFMRYAHDFVVTDAQGKLFRTDGATPEDWHGYGAPVFASHDGVVHGMHDGMPDNRKGAPPPFDQAALMKNLKLFLGNHVLIDHGNGEYSLYAHLKQGSVAVKPGQRVARGERIGGMGMSGDAFLVHLHYQLQSGPGFEEGLPAYFEGMRVRTGAGWSARFNGPVDSGQVVEAASP